VSHIFFSLVISLLIVYLRYKFKLYWPLIKFKNQTKTLNSREYTNREDHKPKEKDITCKVANIIHGELEGGEQGGGLKFNSINTRKCF